MCVSQVFATTEVGIGFTEASISTTSSQSSTIDSTSTTTTSIISDSSSSSSAIESTPSSSLIGGVVPIDNTPNHSYRFQMVQEEIDRGRKILPQTGEKSDSLIFIGVGILVFLCAGGLYFYQLRGEADEKN